MRKFKKWFALALIFIMVLAANITHAATSNISVSLSGEQDDSDIFTDSITITYEITDTEGVKTVGYIIDDEECESDDFSPGSDLNPTDAYFTSIGGSYEVPTSYLKEIKNDTLKHEAKVKVTDADGNVAYSDAIEFKSNPADKIESSTIDIELSGQKSSGIYTGQITLDVTAQNTDTGITGLAYYIDSNEDEEEYISYEGEEEVSKSFELDMEYFAQNEPGDYNHTIIVSVTNENDEVTEESVEFKVNVSKPEINMNAKDGYSYSKDFTVEVTANDQNPENLSFDMSVTKDGNVVKNINSENTTSQTYTTEGEGKYTIIAKATDEAGNACEETVSFEIDASKPGIDEIEFEGSKKEGYEWFNDTVTIKTKAYDKDTLKKITLNINGTTLLTEDIDTAEYDFTYTVDKDWLSENPKGVYNVEITVEDEAGNKKSNEGIFYAAVNNPAITINGVEDGGIYSPELEIQIIPSADYADYITTYLTLEGPEHTSNIEDNGTITYSNFESEGEYTLSAYAIDPAGNMSNETNLSFEIDSTPPAISNIKIEGEHNEGYSWYSGPVTISAESTDEDFAKSYITVNGVKVKESTEPKISVTLSETWLKENISDEGDRGEYNVIVYVEDDAGNIRKEVAQFYADVDTPVLTIEGLIDGYAKGADFVSVETSDMSKTTSYIEIYDGSKTSTYVKQGSSILLSDLTTFDYDKEYTITAYSVDQAGNISNEETVAFKLDNTKPVITGPSFKGTKVEGTDFYDGTVDVSFSAEDEQSGIASVSLRAAGDVVYNSTETFSKTVTLDNDWFIKNINSDGKYLIEVIAEDTAGNRIVKSETVYVSSSKPVTAISGIKDAITSEKQTLKVEAIDPLDSNLTTYIKINKDGKTYKEITSNELITTFSDFNDDGLYEISAYVVNSKGIKSDVETVNFTKDATKPTVDEITFEGEKNSEWYNSDIAVKSTAKDATSNITSIVVTVNDIETRNWNPESKEEAIDETIPANWISNNEASDGKYTVKIKVSDEAGNASTVTKVFYADVSAPTISLSGITNGAFLNKTPTLTVKTTDNLGATTNITVTKDGKSWEKLSETKETITYNNFTEDGLYKITVQAVDAGGKTSKSQNISFTKDTAKPEMSEIELGGTVANGWYSDEVNISASAKDETSNIVSAIVTINDIEVKNITNDSSDISIDETITKEWFAANKSRDGKYTIKIVLKDQAGNSKTSTKVFYADVSAPTISLSGITNGAFLNKTPTLTVKTNDDYISNVTTKIIVTKNGEAYDEVSSKKATTTYNNFNDDGVYKITVKAIDLSLNESEEKTISFTKDTVEPEVSSPSLTGHREEGYMWFNGNVTASVSAKDTLSKLKNCKIIINSQTVANKSFDGSDQEKITHIIDSDWIKENMSSSGRYDIYFVLTDLAGNQTTVYDTFYVDLDTPEITLSGFSNGAFLNTSPEFSVMVNDDYSMQCTSYITIKKDGKDFASEKYEGRKYTYEGFEKDGRYDITVYTCDKAGNTSKTKKLSFTKDTVAPVVSLSGAKEGEYTNKDRKITVAVKEKNYSNVTVDVTGTKKTRTAVSKVAFGDVKPTSANYTCSKTYKASGTYTFKVTARDAAGNIATADSLKFTIDKEKPIIKISDIPKQNNYNSTVAPKVTWEDDNIGSKKISLTRATGGTVDGLTYTDKNSVYTGSRNYANFIKKRAYDDVYTLTCTVTDKAGNSNTDAITFTVNRFGSTFSLSKEAKKINKKYVDEVEENIIIYEKNVSGLKTRETFIYKDGEKIEGTVTVKESTKNDWFVYAYKFNRNSFREEGVYTINIVSLDKAGNTSEYMKDGKTPFKFYVDSTAPMISVTGVSDRGNYKDGATAVVEVTDAIGVKSCKAIVKDGSKVLLEKELTEKDMTVKMPEGRDLTLLVYATDEAGNRGKATVTEITTGISAASSFAKVALLLFSAILLTIFIIFLLYKRRKDDETA